VIGAQNFFITQARAGILALFGIVVLIGTLMLVFLATFLFVASSTNCVNIAYSNMGRKDSVLLLSHLTVERQKLMPYNVTKGMVAFKSSFNTSGLVLHYRDSNDYEGLSLDEIAALRQKIDTNVYCDLTLDRELYFWILRDLGLGTVARYVLTERNAELVIAVEPMACRMNFSSGFIR